MVKQKKYYVVWEGYKTGVLESWEACKRSTSGYKGAKYKAYTSREEAEEAFMLPYAVALLPSDPPQTNSSKVCGTSRESLAQEKPSVGIAVDGACRSNPGPAEYQGVRLSDGVVLFAIPPFPATNNVVEFLAIVHAMALCVQEQKRDIPIYSDSRNAIGWVMQGKCKTHLPKTATYKRAYELIERAEKWLAEHPYSCRPPLRKWETKQWGENPADYGRK